MAELPSGTVTFLFTDIQGSTELLKRLGADYAGFLVTHRQLLRDAVAASGGHEMGSEGDAMFFWFPRVRQAARAAADAQLAIAAHEWPQRAPLRVRMGLHTAEPDVVESEYIGMGIHRAARICSAAHGGQVLLSHATAGVLVDDKLSGLGARRLGEYRLKDLDEPEVLYQLVADDLPPEFPPPRAEPAAVVPGPTTGRRRWLAVALGVAVLGAGGAVAALVLAGEGGKPSASPRTTTPRNAQGRTTTGATRRPRTTPSRATTTARHGHRTTPTPPVTTTSSHKPTPPPAKSRPRGVEQAWFKASFIPYPARRKLEMAAYAKRHYGIDSWRLVNPKVIVEHYSVTSTAAATIAGFAADTPDPELGSLPGDCAHFVVDRDGTVYQLVRTSIMCRHTVGLNYTAIGIEHVGASDADILDHPRQLAASLRLTLWLMSRYRIVLANVIGHNESLRSPFRRERYAAWRCQTHPDWTHADMVRYRRLLYKRGIAEGLRSLVRRAGIEGPNGATPGC